jgi:hypothetical protein
MVVALLSRRRLKLSLFRDGFAGAPVVFVASLYHNIDRRAESFQTVAKSLILAALMAI